MTIQNIAKTESIEKVAVMAAEHSQISIVLVIAYVVVRAIAANYAVDFDFEAKRFKLEPIPKE